ncbi:hypothetical protein D3C87_1188270 [compost metagenome]
MHARKAGSLFTGIIEIAAILDHFSAKAAHGVVLFYRVTLRHDDQRPQTQCASRQRQALAMVAAGSADDALRARVLAFEPVHEGDTTTYLEGTGRRVIFVLDPHRATQPLSQQGPRVLGGGRHDLVNAASGLFDIVASQSVHEWSP